eukprot:CAMPEP_0178417718 /NCGR_PEP_ID=MMETSP0689_2-20121128/24715_1 /TAXON_ID=160604 /ORGANISM="Amphidinium massartii, Strain CS-259" /LENGTH=173 /DNA_ID=CAMNT_0020039085 /DNA_START=94 /DNA_END=615 /DNA_ORIENTATION=+
MRPLSFLLFAALALAAVHVTRSPQGAVDTAFLQTSLRGAAAASPLQSESAFARRNIVEGEELRATSTFSATARTLCGASLVLAAAVAARDAVVVYIASPKTMRAPWKVRQNKKKWYAKYETKAEEALRLAIAVKEGTADFIYGKVQDDEDEDDFFDDDDDFADDDNLSTKSIS